MTRYRAPLLVTKCDLCFRRRACYAMPGEYYIFHCRQCIGRVMRAGGVAAAEFFRQGWKVGR